MIDAEDSAASSSSEEVNLLVVARYLLSKWYWLLLGGVVGGALVFAAVSLFITPSYQSSVSFYVYNSPDSVATTKTVNNQDLQAAESLATTYSNILESNIVLDAVLDDLGDNRRGLTRSELSDMVDASVITNTQLLEVVVSSNDADFACRIAESFENVAPRELQNITKVGGVEIVDQPEVATRPASPRTLFDSAIGLVIGVIVAGIILGVRMMADQTIYMPEDIENSVTVLGVIPTIDIGIGQTPMWRFTSNDGDGNVTRA